MPNQDPIPTSGWRRAREAAADLCAAFRDIGMPEQDVKKIQRGNADDARSIYVATITRRSAELLCRHLADGQPLRGTPAARTREVLTRLGVPGSDIAAITDRQDLTGGEYVHLGTISLRGVEKILTGLSQREPVA
jgi:hypothetical protein